MRARRVTSREGSWSNCWRTPPGARPATWRDIQERAVAVSPEAVARLTTLREPLPAGPSDAADVVALLDEVGSPATMAHGRAALLRLRHRRRRCRRRWPPTGSRRPGTRTRPSTRVTPAVSRARGGRAGLAAATCSGCPTDCGGRVRDRRDDGQLHRARRGPPRRARARRAGTSRPTGCSARRRSRSWSARRRTRRCSRRSGCSASGATGVVRVPVDGQGRMRADALPPLTRPTIVCAQAGNVNTGAFDPLAEIAARTREAGRLGARRRRVRPVGARPRRRARIWPAASSAPTRGRPTRTSGSTCRTTAASPSCATPMRCAPRWPSRPPTCRAERRARTRRDYTPELSRRARGVEVWAALRSLGRAGLAELVERMLPARRALRRRARRGRLRDPQRRRAEPGAGLVRRAGGDASA